MKKIIYSIAVFLTSIGITHNSYAMWPDLTPFIPLAPQFCPMCTPPAVLTALSYVQQVKAIKDDLTKFTDMSQLKQMATSYAPKMGATAMNSWRQKPAAKKKVISFSRTIEECSVADINDPASVKDAFIKLFMQYPSKKNSVKAAYAEMGEQLKMDTTLEMFITAKEMEKELLGKEPGKEITPTAQNLADLGILKQIDLIESCLVEGKNCDVIGLDACVESKKGSESEEGKENDEDNVCYWNSALQAEKFYDAVMRYNEFLVSMHAQYQAVLGIEKLAKIREKNDNKNDNSSLQIVPKTQDYVSSMISADMAFADMSDAEKQANEDLHDYNEMLATHENVMGGEFEENDKASGFESALDGRDADLASMSVLAEVQDDLNKAMRVHNLKQLLPDYRRVYQDYNTAKKQHDLALENIAVSGGCITDMLNPYYSDAKVAWHGNDCQYFEKGKLICHYKPEQTFDENNAKDEGDLNTACPGDEGHKCYVISLAEAETKAKGISGYLVTLYAKAKDMEATSDADSFIEAKTEEGRADTNVARTTIDSSFTQEEGKDMFVATRDQDEKEGKEGRLGILEQATQKADNENDSSSSHLKDQRQGDEEKANARKDGILRWVLGSLAAKEVAVDLDTGEHNFGNRSGKFPLWTDQKIFYNQYIDGKYDNIKEYIETMPMMEIVLGMAGDFNAIYPYEDIYAGEILVKSAEDQRSENGKAISGAQQASKPVSDNEDALIATKLQEENALFDGIRTAYYADIAALNAQKEKIYDDLDSNNAKIDEKNTKYNENNLKIKAAEDTSDEARDAVKYGDDLYADRQLSRDAPQNTKDQADPEVIGFKTKDNRNEAEKADAITKKAEAGDTAAEEARAEALNENLKEVKEQIEERRKIYVKNLSDAEIASRLAFDTFAEELKTARVINNAIDSSLTSIEPVGLAVQVAECVRTYALEQVAKAKAELDAMKPTEELYRQEFTEKVQTIHKEMIDKITNISLEDLAATCPVISELQQMASAAQENQSNNNNQPQNTKDPLGGMDSALNILGKTCEKVGCEKADNEYFVGAIGLPRDLKAPNQATEFSSAPLREIFHFDVFDYNNLAKYYEGTYEDVESNLDIFTSATNVLEYLNGDARSEEYGSTVPEIWFKILKRHAFVQKEFDLVDLLSGTEDITNSTRKALSRSGVFPCRDGSHVIDVSLDLDYMVDETKDADKYNTLPTCKGLVLKSVDGRVVVFDEEVGGGNLNLDPPSFTGNVVRASELGNILAYTPDKEALIKAKLLNPSMNMQDVNALPHRLTFNANLMRAVKKIVETDNVGEEGHEGEDSLFYLASRVMLERNQFGDYLDQLENEAIKADELQKIEKQIYDIRTNLLEVFEGTGFELGEDFDLTNPEDYEQANSTLDNQKDVYMKQSLKKLGEVKGTSQMVATKLGKLLNKIAILSADSDEIVAITGDENEADLKQKIEESKANQEVSEEYTKEREKEIERRLQRYRRPYCSVYPR